MKNSLLYLAAALLCGVSSSTDSPRSKALPIQTEQRPAVLVSTPPPSLPSLTTFTAQPPKMVLVARHRWKYDTSGYSKHDDGPKWGKRFANVNFLRGGKYYAPENPYPREWTDTRMVSGKVVAVPKWCEWVHSARIKYPNGMWLHRYRVYVPGYGLAWPLDRITRHDRFDCYYGGDQSAAKRHGVKRLDVVIYEVTFR